MEKLLLFFIDENKKEKLLTYDCYEGKTIKGGRIQRKQCATINANSEDDWQMIAMCLWSHQGEWSQTNFWIFTINPLGVRSF